MEEPKQDKCTPIGVFWDIENCSVPKWRSALWVVQKIRTEFSQGHREVEFMCVCDASKESKVVIQELNSAQSLKIVCILANSADPDEIWHDAAFRLGLHCLPKYRFAGIPNEKVNVVHIDAISKNAADDKLRQNIRRFADIYSPPASIVLISSDVNFSSDLSDLRHRRKFDIILIHKEHTHDSLIVCANQHILYEDLIKDIPPRSPSKQCLDGQAELKVTGFPAKTTPKLLKNKIQQLANNTGGKVISVTVNYVLVRFSSSTVAERARKRMDGEDVCGSKIKVQFSLPGKESNVTESQNGHVQGRKGTPPRDNNNNNKNNKNNSNNKRNNSSPKHQKGNNGTSNHLSRTSELQLTSGNSIDRGSSPIQNLGVDSLGTVKAIAGREGMQDVVKKLSHEKKSSRQMLMLQQQIYQEEQTPIGELQNNSTQFYSHYSKQSYTSSYYMNQQTWQPYGGCYQEKYQQKNYNNGYKSYNGTGYLNGYRSDQGTCNCYGYNGNHQGFCPIRSPSPTDSIRSISPCDPEYENEYPNATELLVSNLDYNISPREWKHILLTTFHPHVKILCITVNLQPDNTSLAFIKVGSLDEGRFAISQFHRKKIGYKRIHVTLRNDEMPKSVTNIRNEAIALLSEAVGNVLPLFKFIELYDKRYHKTVSVAELYRIGDTIEIREQGGAGRMVSLHPSLQRTPTPEEGTDSEVKEILEQSICSYHCPEGSAMYVEAVNSSMLPNVKLQLKTFAAQVHSLLMSHDGEIPLMSFPACYSAEVAPLVWVLEGGVSLEHLISCVPGIEIMISKNGVKKVSWAENKPPVSIEFGQHCSSPLLTQQLNQLSRELIDLLKTAHNCRLPLSKFIPSYHHHFGRQCRVADYGYTKLMELFEALPHVVQVLGTGDRKVLTLTHRSQVKRFTADLLRLLKANPGRKLSISYLQDDFKKLMGRPWDIVEYGVCCVEDMLAEIPETTVTVTVEGTETLIGMPRKEQTPEESEKTKQFCLEVVDLLKHSQQYRMMFNKFVPSYHHHFGHQCRVSDYGFSKLQDLFEAIPHVVEVVDEGEEKYIHLTDPELRKVIGEQIVELLKQKKAQCFPLDSLMLTFTLHYGFMIPLHDLKVATMEELMTKLKHVLKLEVYEGKSYVVLADRSSAPPLARQVLQLLMDQSGGSLPLMELCSRYRTTFGVDPDLSKIKEELLDYVQVSGDDESAVISLTPLQTLARDIRILLQIHGKMTLSQFERLFFEQFGTEIKPALYGFPTTVALLMTIPHVVTIKGKGNRRMVHLSGDLQSSLPIIDESYTRPDSDTPSNDSGSALTDEDLPVTEPRKFSPCDLMSLEARTFSPSNLISDPKMWTYDLLAGRVPSNVPSPNILPELFSNSPDLMNFESPSDCRDEVFTLTEEEKRQQMSPLCHSPTSQLLKLAAQFLPSSVEPPSKIEMVEQSGVADSVNTCGGVKSGWWRASPSQLEEVSKTTQDNIMAVEKTDRQSVPPHLSKNSNSAESAFNKESPLKQTNKQGIKTDLAQANIDESETQSRDNVVASKSNSHLRYNSLSELIEQLKRENAASNMEQNASKEIEVSKGQSQGNESGKIEPQPAASDGPIARCPKPLQPGSYWYSKQFSSPDEKELPSTSTQEVRNVLAALTSNKKSHARKLEVTETDPQMKLEEISTDESSETSQSYSTDTITESSDDKLKSGDKSTTLEDALSVSKELGENQIDKAGNIKEDNDPAINTTPDTEETLKTNDLKVDNNNDKAINKGRSESSNDLDTRSLGSIDDLNEIKPNQFVNGDDKICEVENDKQLSEISSGEFIEDCLSSDCMSYEAIFRQYDPLETSSLKSDTSFGTDSPANSPRKQPRIRHKSHSSISDGSLHSPSKPSPRRCRIAAKFEQPLN